MRRSATGFYQSNSCRQLRNFAAKSRSSLFKGPWAPGPCCLSFWSSGWLALGFFFVGSPPWRLPCPSWPGPALEPPPSFFHEIACALQADSGRDRVQRVSHQSFLTTTTIKAQVVGHRVHPSAQPLRALGPLDLAAFSFWSSSFCSLPFALLYGSVSLVPALSSLAGFPLGVQFREADAPKVV